MRQCHRISHIVFNLQLPIHPKSQEVQQSSGRVGSKALLCQHIRYVQIKRNSVECFLHSHPLPHCPPHPIGPIDQIKVAHIHQRALVFAPFAAVYTHQPIVWSLHLSDQLQGQAKRAQKREIIHHGPVGEVSNRILVGRRRIERPRHVRSRELREGRSAETQSLNQPVRLGQVEHRGRLPVLIGRQHHIPQCRPAMRTGNGDERGDVRVPRRQAADHVARVEAAHGMGNDVDLARGYLAAARCGVNVITQLGGAVLDGAGRRNGAADDGGALGNEGVLYPVPVLDSGKVARQLEFGEAQEAVGQDDGVFRGIYRKEDE